jgi:hypothetical protein
LPRNDGNRLPLLEVKIVTYKVCKFRVLKKIK